jgi:hypothetical protein
MDVKAKTAKATVNIMMLVDFVFVLRELNVRVLFITIICLMQYYYNVISKL